MLKRGNGNAKRDQQACAVGTKKLRCRVVVDTNTIVTDLIKALLCKHVPTCNNRSCVSVANVIARY
jgi:hypothetical protein